MIAAAGNPRLPAVLHGGCSSSCSSSRSPARLITAACSFYSHLSPPLRSLPWVSITSLRGTVPRAKFESFDGTDGLATAEDGDAATTPSVEGLLEGENEEEDRFSTGLATQFL